MSTVIDISPGSLMSLGSTTLSTSDDHRLASTLIAAGTTLSTGSVRITAHAADIELTKSYVESLNDEEINDMLNMLDERELILNNEGQKLVLKY